MHYRVMYFQLVQSLLSMLDHGSISMNYFLSLVGLRERSACISAELIKEPKLLKMGKFHSNLLAADVKLDMGTTEAGRERMGEVEY